MNKMRISIDRNYKKNQTNSGTEKYNNYRGKFPREIQQKI